MIVDGGKLARRDGDHVCIVSQKTATCKKNAPRAPDLRIGHWSGRTTMNCDDKSGTPHKYRVQAYVTWLFCDGNKPNSSSIL